MGNPEQHTQSISKRRVLIVAACIAAATFALLICAEIFLPSKPPSFFGLGFGPSSTTGFMVLLGPALAAWAFSIYVRCPDATIRNQLIAIAALLAFWLLDVIVKYPMKSDLGTSICWYLYYVPMTFIRAPYIVDAHEGATPLATVDGRIVAVRAGNQLGVAFHPELDDDLRIHKLFVSLIG